MIKGKPKGVRNDIAHDWEAKKKNDHPRQDIQQVPDKGGIFISSDACYILKNRSFFVKVFNLAVMDWYQGILTWENTFQNQLFQSAT